MNRKRKLLFVFILAALMAVIFASYSALGADNFELEIADFPESYKVQLRELHKKYPNWKFLCVDTGIDWADAVEGENYAPSVTGTRSTIQSSASSFLKDKSSGFYNASKDTYTNVDGGFVRANKTAISFFMDPRNFLDESGIFQFESLSFSDKIEVSDVDSVLINTFMYNSKIKYLDSSGNSHTENYTYAACIYDAGKTYNINPCFLASKIRNEVVVGSFASGSVSGSYSGYEGYYNFYNIGAYSGVSPITNALKYAKESGSYNRPWDTPRKSIFGGAQFLAQTYISKGQDTGYFQKYNVSPGAVSSVYTHQYMTNVAGAVSQAKSTYNSYCNNGLLSNVHIFSIPVFNDMPGADGQMKDFSLFDSLGQTAVPNIKSNQIINVRAEPSYSSSVVASLKASTTVNVLSKCSTTSSYVDYQIKYPFWYHIQFTQDGKTYTGYALADFLTPVSQILVNKGSVFTLPAKGLGSEDPVLYTWDTSVLSVDGNNVSALNDGTAYVSATTSAGGFDHIKIKVGSYNNSAYTVPDFSLAFTEKGAEFSWKKVNGISGYEIIVYSGASAVYAQTLSATQTCVTIPGIDTNSDVAAMIRAYVVSENSKLNGEFSCINIECAQLSSVKGLMCDNITTSSYSLKWNSVANAQGYELYRFNQTTGEYELFKTLNSASCDFTSVQPGSYDRYKVRAYAKNNSGMIYSPYSEVIEGYTYLKEMYSPTVSSVEKTAAAVKWNSVEGADIYYIYMYDESSCRYVKYAQTDKTEYKFGSLKSSTVYRLRIEACRTSSGALTRIAGHDITLTTLTGKVKGLKQTSSTGSKVRITWNGKKAAYSYRVYILNKKTGKYSLYKETTDNVCEIGSLSSMSKYSVKVRAVVKNGNVKTKCASSDVIKVYTGPKKTGSVSVNGQTYKTVKLRWSAVYGAKGYRIYRINKNTGKETLIATTSSTSYTVKSLKSGTKYKFRIRAYRVVGSKKINGTAFTKTVKTLPGEIKNLTSSKHTSKRYTLSWSASGSADGYIIYRYNASLKKYIKVAQTKKTSYTFKDLTSAKKAKYKVAGYIAVNGKKYTGKLSKPYKTSTVPKNTTSVTAELSADSSVSVSWNACARAAGYGIYAYDDVSGKWVFIDNCENCSYIIPACDMVPTYSRISVRSYVTVSSENYYSSGTEADIE